jgi:glycosyltransferase involved in cell wall biosynthesis
LRNIAIFCKVTLTKLANFERPKFVRFPKIDLSQVVDAMSSSGCEFDVVEYPKSRTGLAVAVQEHGIDVVLPCVNSLGSDFPHKWIGYVPDLQHKHLPQFFSRAALQQRDRQFQRLLRDARTLIVNSRQVKSDLEQHFQTGTCNIVVLPFSPLVQAEWFTTDVKSVQERYALTAPYFLISNQFWQHKDHATAFKALSLLAVRDVELICTGSASDYRAPEYFGKLQALISERGLQGRVRFLGHIPKPDQIAIMRGAVAVLQPTLFEGGPGGGSVYDAVAVGTPAIISDIPVNREIVEKGVEFFPVGSAQHLAERMAAVLESPVSRVSNDALMERAAVRRQRLSAALTRATNAAFEEAECPVAHDRSLLSSPPLM